MLKRNKEVLSWRYRCWQRGRNITPHRARFSIHHHQAVVIFRVLSFSTSDVFSHVSLIDCGWEWMWNRLCMDKKKKERLASFWLRRSGTERINTALICSANNERGKAY